MQRTKENPYREKIRYSLQSYEAHLHPAHLKLLAQLLRSQRLALLGPQQLPIELHSRTHARCTRLRAHAGPQYASLDCDCTRKRSSKPQRSQEASTDRQTDSGAIALTSAHGSVIPFG